MSHHDRTLGCDEQPEKATLGSADFIRQLFSIAIFVPTSRKSPQRLAYYSGLFQGIIEDGSANPYNELLEIWVAVVQANQRGEDLRQHLSSVARFQGSHGGGCYEGASMAYASILLQNHHELREMGDEWFRRNIWQNADHQ